MDLMAALINQQKFNEGYRYADYTVGDKLAAFGIASLVAVTAGGNQQTKAGLAALLGSLAALGKKLLVPIIIALGAIGAFFKKLFGSKNPQAEPEKPADV
ncbi:MAG: DUF2167 domain-containing protein [Nitrospinaceae bacterium]|nr:DUF2167 domain-containing protein [Nitrospinaceae bacterium]NIR56272.1 DUF2167 domain-containing protein [Nitrospinaceae bacterium]NIS86729.1 DUF2167 domain-containing protein [Nitrospinaceae bacterium]NIT83561.1 DUF2167 domain-containing protein [Nitrospinaceae bacterium]NIU45766.1 DUF2167 domain-containing protein [Nitrospinaceae bacterium]